MILVVGGYAQGKLQYVLDIFKKTEKDILDTATFDVQTWNGQTVINHIPAQIARWIQQKKNPQQLLAHYIPNWKNVILITQEMGCGLIPMDVKQRVYREQVGQCNTLLAQAADRVDQVVCGIGIQIK